MLCCAAAKKDKAMNSQTNLSKQAKLTLPSLCLGIAGYLAAIALAPAAIAQVTNATTLSEQTLREAQQQERSPLSVGGSNLNLLQLINNINLIGSQSPEQFRANQNESLNEAVTNFRNQRQRDLTISIPNK